MAELDIQPIESEEAPESPEDIEIERITITLLRTADDGVFPVFTQGDYRRVRLPFRDSDGDVRRISGSGCALCALCCYLQVTGCTIDGAPADPASLTAYLRAYVEEHDLDLEDIFGRGSALEFDDDLDAAINALALASHPDGLSPTFTTSGRRDRVDIGEEVEGLVEHLERGEPALLGVRRAGRSHHIVLAVGYTRIEGQTYYLVNDSARLADCRPTAYDLLSGPLTRDRVKLYAACPERSDSQPHRWIYRVRLLSGLGHYVGLHAREHSG